MPPEASPVSTELRPLRARWAAFALLGSLLLWGGLALFRTHWQPAFAYQWLLVAALVLAYQLGKLWPDLPLNRRPDERKLLSAFGWGTGLSLVRMLCVALLGGFLALPLPPLWLAWLPAALNLVSNFSDFLDGYAARVSNHVTLLGRKLDMDLDGRGLLIVTLLAYQYGKVPWWFLPVGLARYLFVLGLWWRARRGLPTHTLKPSQARRAFAGVQMGFATAMLVPAFSPPETTLAAGLFMLPFLGNFLADWWQVSGATELRARWDAFWGRVWVFASGWGALGLRFALTALLLVRLFLAPASATFALLEIGTAGFMALGAAGRVTAVLVLLETGFRMQAHPSGWLDPAIIVVASALLFLGSGPYSLWRPEDDWIQHRAGERRRAP